MYQVMDYNMFETNRYGNKQQKKVSKYKDKYGNIKKEYDECINWANDLQGKSWILRECYDCTKEKVYKYNIRRKIKAQYSVYMSNKLSYIINKNKYKIEKCGKKDGYSLYSKEDVAEFILVLVESLNKNRLREFLDIPDVFYIARQIKYFGVEYYLIS